VKRFAGMLANQLLCGADQVLPFPAPAYIIIDPDTDQQTISTLDSDIHGGEYS